MTEEFLEITVDEYHERKRRTRRDKIEQADLNAVHSARLIDNPDLKAGHALGFIIKTPLDAGKAVAGIHQAYLGACNFPS